MAINEANVLGLSRATSSNNRHIKKWTDFYHYLHQPTHGPWRDFKGVTHHQGACARSRFNNIIVELLKQVENVPSAMHTQIQTKAIEFKALWDTAKGQQARDKREKAQRTIQMRAAEDGMNLLRTNPRTTFRNLQAGTPGQNVAVGTGNVLITPPVAAGAGGGGGRGIGPPLPTLNVGASVAPAPAPVQPCLPVMPLGFAANQIRGTGDANVGAGGAGGIAGLHRPNANGGNINNANINAQLQQAMQGMQQNPNAGLLAQFPGHVMNVRNNRQQNAGGNIHNRNRDLVGHLDAQEHRQNDQIRQIAAARNARGTNTLAKTKTLKVLCEIASHTNVLGQNLADQVQEAVRGETRNLLADLLRQQPPQQQQPAVQQQQQQQQPPQQQQLGPFELNGFTGV